MRARPVLRWVLAAALLLVASAVLWWWPDRTDVSVAYAITVAGQSAPPLVLLDGLRIASLACAAVGLLLAAYAAGLARSDRATGPADVTEPA